MLAIPLALPPAGVIGYYAYKKLTAPSNVVGSYGEIDGELGWKLKPNATSRYWMTNKLTGETFFDSLVHTNALGFRAASTGGMAPKEGIVAIGDSWTFGYAVNYEESFPARLGQVLGQPVVNLGVPAYGSAQTVLLFERYLPELEPKAVVHLNLGLWNRSLCHGETPPAYILKPCFWWNPAAEKIELIAPRPGYVESMAAKGVYPGGWLTAGNSTWSYYLISRPITKVKQFLTAAGLLPGHRSEYDTDPVLTPRALAYTLRRMGELARRHGFVFVLADPRGDYAQAYSELAAEYKNSVFYFSPERWQDEIGAPAMRLPVHQRRVPKDGHFGPGKNRLIAEALARFLKPLLAQP
jgi:lysophospholipase L1-like esterase